MWIYAKNCGKKHEFFEIYYDFIHIFYTNRVFMLAFIMIYCYNYFTYYIVNIIYY